MSTEVEELREIIRTQGARIRKLERRSGIPSKPDGPTVTQEELATPEGRQKLIDGSATYVAPDGDE